MSVLDLAEVEAALANGGPLTLPVRSEEWEFQLTENGVIPEWARWVEAVGPSGAIERTGEYVTARTYDGLAVGRDASIALTVDLPNRLVLGLVWERFDGQERMIDLATVGDPAAGSILLESSWIEGLARSVVEPLVGTQGHQGIKYKAIGAFGDQEYRWTYGSQWTTRISNAINAQHSMWYSQTSIDIFIGAYRESPNHGGECYAYNNNDYMLLRFKNWLLSTGQGDDFPVKQLWTEDSLNGCIGEGYPQQMLWTEWASSVLEGGDWWPYDGYDPDYASDAGIVSAEEMAHNHHNGGHPCTKNSAGQVNVMSSCHDVNDRIFWFESTYQNGIHLNGYSKL